MKTNRLRRLVTGALAFLVLAGLLLPGAIPGTRLGLDPSGARVLAQGGLSIHLPFVSRSYLDPAQRLSRFGVSHTNLLASPQASLNSLRIGYHWDFGARRNPVRPGGIEYAQTIRLEQLPGSSPCYTYRPSGATLDGIIARNPGALWFIGNEPDRIQDPEWGIFQDNIEPQCYARAYADLYWLIKGKDPAARIAAGNIVEPTPMRRRYLDIVLQTYSAENGGAQMPVDVWSIHMYILPENQDDWGAKVPPGITDTSDAATYTIEDNYSFDKFKELVKAFRKWMQARGYQDTPLYVTEYGVLMPWDYIVAPKKPGNAKSEAEAKAQADQIVSDYMAATMNYMLTQTTDYGYPADGNRLVQRWAWYSHEDLSSFNGHLFDPVTKQRTTFGDRYAAIAAAQPATVNLYAWKLWTNPASGFSKNTKDVRIYATVVNNGSVQTRNAVAVRFHDGNPDGGGAQIGATQYIAPLDGGAGLATVSVPWTPATAKTYQLYVRVDPLNSIAETNEGDNTATISVVVNP